jgi:hypothetical protein
MQELSVNNENDSYETQVSVRYSFATRSFDISASVGRPPFEDKEASPQVENLRLSFERLVAADGELLQHIGRFVQTSIFAELISKGLSDQDLRVIRKSLEVTNRASTDDELAASAVRRVIVSRVVRMATSKEHAYSMSDFPKLLDVAMLLGSEDALRLKQRWPRIRRQLAALSIEEDSEKRTALLKKFQKALMGTD